MRIRFVLALVVAAAVVLLTAGPSLAASPFPVAPGQSDMGPIPVDPEAANPGAALVSPQSVGSLLGLGAIAQNGRLADGLPFTFLATPYAIRTLTPGQLPFFGPAIISIVDGGVHDAAGVRMQFAPDGLLYNHVTAQANYGLDNLNAYRLTGDGRYLARAKAQAKRLIDRHVEVNGAWFHPYEFTFGSLQPPWYSALGQGQVLVFFTRLYEATGGDPLYKSAADGTFASFLIKGPVDGPWVVDVDDSNHLWLQEYPGPHPDFTFNGHMFAALDLYDYYRVFHDARALELFRGATTTAADYAAAFRQIGGRSLYCLAHRTVANASYHEAHVQELLSLFKITGEARFARLADNFENDWPRDVTNGLINVATGKATAVRFASTGGAVLQRRVLAATKPLRFRVSARRRVPNLPGYWFRVHGGTWNGWWLKESAPRVYAPGQLVRLDYVPTRSLTLPAGTARILHKYAANGTVLASLKLTATQATTIHVRARAIVNGRTQLLVSSTPGAGYWIDLAGLTLI